MSLAEESPMYIKRLNSEKRKGKEGREGPFRTNPVEVTRSRKPFMQPEAAPIKCAGLPAYFIEAASVRNRRANVTYLRLVR